ncbi:histidine phosphatase family protein [Mobilitalea sibirica]|uniref:Histidine phosphatase family protein n=1 Tax=Mobilitalea sibirica TaxID=1462919 RepID=A0A8J7KWG6_9FIRM|nr:histidine phosphatase family protein [Mobilitalea sibirica]
MTHVYFVRHALPDNRNNNDRYRPLTEEGHQDSYKVTAHFKDKPIDFIMSSPYKRSVDTIKDLANALHMEIHTDEDFREREKGIGYGHDATLYVKNMWNDFQYKTEGAECLAEVQKRNIRALKKLLTEHKNENIIVATHGTALSTILNYYDATFHYDDFMRIINFMPYIIRLDFDNETYLSRFEELIIKKEA